MPKVMQDYDEAIRLDPRNVDTYYNRAVALFVFDRLDEAIHELDEAIRLDPNQAGAYVNRAMAHTLLGDDTKSQRDIDAAVDLGVEHAELDQLIKSLEIRK